MAKPYKLGLSQIVKNEAHVIERMLNTITSIVDCVVIVDTGSTDNTKEVINNWSVKTNIPAFIYDKQFDSFENCRNYAMEMIKDKAEYAFWLDADEQLEILPTFDKNKLDKDLYMFNTFIGNMKYTRNECWRTELPFRWYGPVHEFIVCDQQNISSGLMEGINVRVQMDGGSWKGNIPDKYKKHAAILEDYIDNIDRNARWVFYTAQSYHDSASIPDNRFENEERFRRSLKYYRERVNRFDGYEEERYYSQLRIGSIMRILEEPWSDTLIELMKAYSMDPMRGESIKMIIDHYLNVGEWHLAYLYSKFAKFNFHGKNPYPTRLLFVDEALYQWRILEVHAAACFYTNRKDEAAANFKELQEVMKKSPQLFSPDEMAKISSNAQFFMGK
jgi:glycosyltransferase involved in cell wall biosynthesis